MFKYVMSNRMSCRGHNSRVVTQRLTAATAAKVVCYTGWCYRDTPNQDALREKEKPIMFVICSAHIYDFHIFTNVDSSLHGFIRYQKNDLFPVGL